MTCRIGLMTSGGDAPGMNAAVRSVVRTAQHSGAQVFGILDGYRGLMNPETGIRLLDCATVSGILSRGGTMLGTARCREMLEVAGRQQAVRALVERGIDRLVVVGGDGSLTGADTLRQEWRNHLQAMIDEGTLPPSVLEEHPVLSVIGLPGTIDNDLCGTDITIGADTALHRIVSALDAIFSTAASHQRTFVVEVMGRHCGYLAVMAGLATGAEWLLIPEDPPPDGWEEQMGMVLSKGRAKGKRATIVLVAEGARDRQGRPISSHYVQQVLEERLGEDARVTILGHVQRGGSPSAYDRNLSSLLGQRAAREALREHIDSSILVGMRGNRPTTIPLMEAVELTRQAQASCTHDAELKGLTLRGQSLADAYHLFQVVNGHPPANPAGKPRRIALVHSGAPAPGMNMAVRTSTRWALAQGHEVLGIRGGFAGLARGDVEELDWMGVSGWAGLGGAELGTSHGIPSGPELYSAARVLEDHGVEALLMIGGWSGYEGVHRLYRERTDYPAFRIPMLCLPASIDNNLPGSEFSVGADTALNSIVEAADRIKRSAVANRRCFLVEVMGDMCGYLAYMSGLATGAEKVYLHESPLTAARLLEDLQELKGSFEKGRSVALVMVNEKAHPLYTTGVLRALFEEEGRAQFDVRQAILGHLQQGGDPTPFDRTMAARLARAAIEHLQESLEQGSDLCGFLGIQPQGIKVWDFHDYTRMIDENHRRPRNQWWLDLNVVVGDMAAT
jgi:6-phosphofructokinase 1